MRSSSEDKKRRGKVTLEAKSSAVALEMLVSLPPQPLCHWCSRLTTCAQCIQPGEWDMRSVSLGWAIPLCSWDLSLCCSVSTCSSVEVLGSVDDGLHDVLMAPHLRGPAVLCPTPTDLCWLPLRLLPSVALVLQKRIFSWSSPQYQNNH